jgi:hypothetical protein
MKKGRTVQAWHFCGDKLRCGSEIPADGVTFTYTGPLVMCESGLHASREPFDALQYAPGPTLCLVNCAGEIVEGDDKLICTERTIIARMDATDLLRYFARMQALSVIHLWEPPDVVLDYLMTGDESIRAAARDAAWDAARDAAGAAARAAARDAAGAAARDAAGAAAWDAAGAAARDAAWDAARAAAWAAARKDFNGLVRECFWEHL